MQTRNHDGVHVVRLDRGEDVLATLTGLCRERGIRGATLQGIGAIEEVEIGAYVPSDRSYARVRLDGAWELLSLQGNVATKGGDPFIHAHVILGDREGRVRGGHLFRARVAVTGEVAITELGAGIVRLPDPDVGLDLWDLGEDG